MCDYFSLVVHWVGEVEESLLFLWIDMLLRKGGGGGAVGFSFFLSHSSDAKIEIYRFIENLA